MQSWGGDSEVFQVGEWHYSPGWGVGGVWKRILEEDFMKEGGAFEKVEQLSHGYFVRRDIIKAKRPEV